MRRLMNIHRAIWVGASILAQIAVLAIVILRFSSYFVYFYAVTTLLSALAVLGIVSSRDNPGYKIAWIILILVFPITGGLFYLLFGGNRLSHRTRRKLGVVGERMIEALTPQAAVLEGIKATDEAAANQARYIADYGRCPPYGGTDTEYLPQGEIMFERLKEELEKAERFIFLEYFIIAEGVMWDSILAILVRKAAQGVDVRVIYDDLGCILRLPYGYERTLEAKGIKCCIFNPFLPILSFHFNNRDHRKIAVIDGQTGFIGGINLADEYINASQRHPRWKDSAVLLRGKAVWSLTVMFLSMWDFLRGEVEDYQQFRGEAQALLPEQSTGYIQPFTDSPLDDEAVSETVYLNLINKAKRYVYITSPYLIVNNEMLTALTSAAKAGVDVRIITPSVGDNWAIYAVTQSNYRVLVENGVRIYLFPGFIHAKTIVVDDDYAVVGTINLDYRSMYLNFECGVWMYHADSVLQVRDDFHQTLAQCQPITPEACRNVPWYKRLGRAILRIFAPLM